MDLKELVLDRREAAGAELLGFALTAEHHGLHQQQAPGSRKERGRDASRGAGRGEMAKKKKGKATNSRSKLTDFEFIVFLSFGQCCVSHSVRRRRLRALLSLLILERGALQVPW